MRSSRNVAPVERQVRTSGAAIHPALAPAAFGLLGAMSGYAAAQAPAPQSHTLLGVNCDLPPALHCPDSSCEGDRVTQPGNTVEMKTRRTYFLEHGTTMNGLMTVNKIDPHDFLSFVHDVDLSGVPPDPMLAPPVQPMAARAMPADAEKGPRKRPGFGLLPRFRPLARRDRF